MAEIVQESNAEPVHTAYECRNELSLCAVLARCATSVSIRWSSRKAKTCVWAAPTDHACSPRSAPHPLARSPRVAALEYRPAGPAPAEPGQGRSSMWRRPWAEGSPLGA
eukprot:scaffold52681_cov37-Tisochrysis_lutea.AAC.7